MVLRRHIILTATLALITLTTHAWAQCTSQLIGTITFHYCNNGVSGTSYQIGDTTFHNFGGKSGTSHQIGDTTFHNFGGHLGTSHQIGNTTFHNFGGQSGTSQQIEGTMFYNW